MAGDNTTRQKVYEIYLSGKTKQEAATELGLSLNVCLQYYNQFMIAQARINQDKNIERILQANAIERELFRLIENDPKNKNIDNLTLIYSNYLA